MMGHNPLSEDLEVYVRVDGFLVMKLKVGEILREILAAGSECDL